MYVLHIYSQMSLFKSRFLFTCSVIYSRALHSFRANSVWYSLCYTLQIVTLENNRFRQWEQLWLYGGNMDSGGLEVTHQFNLTGWDQPNAYCYTLGGLPGCTATPPTHTTTARLVVSGVQHCFFPTVPPRSALLMSGSNTVLITDLFFAPNLLREFMPAPRSEKSPEREVVWV